MSIINNAINIFLSPGITKRKREKGAITIAETLISLGVGATVLAVAFAGVPALIQTRNANSGVSGLAQITSTVRATFGARNNFNGLTTDLARNLAGFPNQFVNGANIQHPWNGDIEIEGNGQQFTVTFEAMPEAGCSSIVSSSLDLANSVSIGGTEVNLDATDDQNTVENEGAAANIAGLCGTGAPNDVVWTFEG